MGRLVKNASWSVEEFAAGLTYIPQWERLDRNEALWQPEGETHVMAQIGDRFFESDGSGSIHRVR
jgi:hypothetical protein